MNKFLLLIALCITVGTANDPRLYNHGVCMFEFRQNDSTKYYLTWSSAYQNGWEHDIYHQVIHFDQSGNTHDDLSPKRYIGTGSDEAQEPVHAAINRRNNTILSVWEDGSGSDAPNVRGQLHKPDGTVLKENWIVAGGTGSQHSANTAHLASSYIVLYADEAAPATAGAVVKAKVIDDSTGAEQKTIQFSPNDQDHWWPVSVSNRSNSRTLVVWGNDGYAVMGTVLYDSSGTITLAHTPKDFLVNTQQYYYQVEWLDELELFLIIARHGAYENLTDSSRVCLLDTTGSVVSTFTIDGGIEREAKMGIRWDNSESFYAIFFPTATNSLVQLNLKSMSTSVSHTSRILISKAETPWVSTGIWGDFVKDISGNEQFDSNLSLLFIQNDTASNNLIWNQVLFPESFFQYDVAISPTGKKRIHVNMPFISSGSIHLDNRYFGASYELLTPKGQVIRRGIIERDEISVSGISPQVLLLKISRNGTTLVKQRVVIP